MKLTKDDLASCHLRERMHLNGGKEWFGYIHVVVEHPRLSRMDKYTRKDKGVQSTWRVDGVDCADLDAALDALAVPPSISYGERLILQRWAEDPEAAWAERGGALEAIMTLGWKGMLDGKRGITEAGRAALQSQEAK